MNEAETRAEYIDPVLRKAGWGKVDGSRIYREMISPGRILGAGKRSLPQVADYVLAYRNHKLAVVEAKAVNRHYTEGLAQAKAYAEKLSVRFTYATNGKQIYQVDMVTGEEKDVESYPSPIDLWNLTYPEKNNWRERFAEFPIEDRGGSRPCRYYQEVAIKNVMEAISEGQKRILLTLATGSGKTFIAFQIAWKLFHSRWNISGEPTRRPRILFLADRNILANQAFNEFSDFPDDSRVRINPSEIRQKGRVPKNASLFFTIFQTFMTDPKKDSNPTPYFGEYPPDFFDLIVIDECHRGGANDESTWRVILEYFSPAVQLGLTATPKRTENVNTYGYFNDPVYVYSLKDGINDGFLTPFRVKQIYTNFTKYIFSLDDTVLEGVLEEGAVYTNEDFNRTIQINEFEAKRVGFFMSQLEPKDKTLVFCADQDHALLIRDMVNQHKSISDPNFCHRVTANDGELGEQYLRDFQDNEKTIPTILTTSRKLSTGVDARNIRNIVLLRPIKSMIEFKQIIGRGTRIFDGKDYFTIYDFVDAHKHFLDPEWDGDPVCPKCGCQPCECSRPERQPCKVCGQRPCVCPKAPCSECGQSPCVCDKEACPVCGEQPCICVRKVKVKLSDGKARSIQLQMVTSFWHPDGTPMSAHEFMEELFGKLPEFFKDENELRTIWSDPTTRRKLLDGLAEKGFGKEQLGEMQKIIDAEKSDLFDVLAYIAYAYEPVSRADRAIRARTAINSMFTSKQQAFLDFVLSHYVNRGVEELDLNKLNLLLRLKYNNAILDATADLGKPEDIRKCFTGFQKYLYQPGTVA